LAKSHHHNFSKTEIFIKGDFPVMSRYCIDYPVLGASRDKPHSMKDHADAPVTVPPLILPSLLAIYEGFMRAAKLVFISIKKSSEIFHGRARYSIQMVTLLVINGTVLVSCHAMGCSTHWFHLSMLWGWAISTIPFYYMSKLFIQSL